MSDQWSVLMFVIQAHKIFNLPAENKILLYCNNKALVNMINLLVNQQRPQFANDTLKPDWDIIHEIISLLKIAPQKIKWVKGHQDNEYNQKELPFAAQLNCEVVTRKNFRTRKKQLTNKVIKF